jgi:hypothetical protein
LILFQSTQVCISLRGHLEKIYKEKKQKKTPQKARWKMSSTKSYRTPEVLEIDLSENSHGYKSNSTAYTSSSSSGKSSHQNYNKSDKSYNKSDYKKSTKSTKSSRSPKPSKSTKSSKPSKSTKSSSTPSIKTIDLNDDVGPSRPRYTQPPPHVHTHANSHTPHSHTPHSHTPHSHTNEDNRPGVYQGGVELGVCNGCAKEESPLRKVSREYLCGECRQSPQFKLITKSTVLKRYPNLDFHDLIDGYQDRTLRCFFVPNWIDPSSHSIKLYYEHEIAALANSK